MQGPSAPWDTETLPGTPLDGATEIAFATGFGTAPRELRIE